MMGNEILLQAKNISIGYESKKENNFISSFIDLSLKKGKLIALIGANGIGKSTLLRTLTGIQKPISGEINLLGKSIFAYDPIQLAQNLSVVLTEKLPPSNLNVFELVSLGRQPYTNWIGKLSPEDINKTNDAILLTGIQGFSQKRHYELSDGQLQKVLIARAIAQDTPLIILDEPTTHLDLLHKITLFRLLKKLASENGKCILFSTHDLDLALQLSDEIVVMTKEKTTQGTPEDLIRKNILNDLFPDENVYFDSQKNNFVFKSL